MAALSATLALLAAVAPTGAQPALAQTPLGRWFDVKVVAMPERKAHMVSVMQNLELGAEEYAFAPATTPEDVRSGAVAVDWAVDADARKTDNELALFASHMSILRGLVASDGPEDARVFIMEDDIKLAVDPKGVQRDIDTVMSSAMGSGGEPAAAPDWEYFTFGRCWDYCSAQEAVSASVVRVFRPLCTHAFAVTKAGARKILAGCASPIRADTTVDFCIADLIKNGVLQAYAPREGGLFWQDRDQFGSKLGSVGMYEECTAGIDEEDRAWYDEHMAMPAMVARHRRAEVQVPQGAAAGRRSTPGAGRRTTPSSGGRVPATAPAPAPSKPSMPSKPSKPADKAYTEKTVNVMKVAVVMEPAGLCEKQSPADTKENTKGVATAAGVDQFVDFDNTDAQCTDTASRHRNRNRRAAATKDKFDVTFAFKDTVSADTVSTLVAAVTARITERGLTVELSVDGATYTVDIKEVTQGTKTVKVLVVQGLGRGLGNATTTASAGTTTADALLAKDAGNSNTTAATTTASAGTTTADALLAKDAGNSNTTVAPPFARPKAAAGLTGSSTAVVLAMAALAAVAHVSA